MQSATAVATNTQPVNPNKALWEKGDFTRIAETMRESGEPLVDTLGITPGMRVLDLGCGDGTTAVPAARRGAQVLGVDIAANLVAAGNARAKAAGLDNLRFEEGDASNLEGIADDSFDLVVSIFGAMFAPRPDEVAKEMVRVARPGGRIVMGNWIPGDPTLVAQILKISSSYSPPPPEGFVSPMTWGVESHVRERFGAGLRWITPLSYREWFGARGVRAVTELDWWEQTEVAGSGGSSVRVTCAPAQHWTRAPVSDREAGCKERVPARGMWIR